jgi:small-conductance mechanosensitive channel/CRP-like cAMP-binding protein
MTAILGDRVAFSAAVLILVLPALILATGELQERLRLRGSPLEEPVATLRNWILPLVALWTLLVWVFDVDASNLFVRLVATGVLVAVTVAVLQVIRYFTNRARQRSSIPGVRHVPQLVLMLPRLIVIIAAGWILFTAVWNVDLSGLFAALGVTSLIISLALQDTLSGLASGLLLLADRPFNAGDWIEVEGLEGRVVDINWRSSRIQDRNGDLLVVPNATISKANVVNFDEPARLHRVVYPVQVAYSNPPTMAKEMLLAAALATEGVLEDPPPDIKVRQTDDPLMGYEAQMWIEDYTNAPRVKSDFGALIWYQSHRMDVPLPSPAFDLYHHDPIQEAADAELSVEDLAERIQRAPALSEINEADLGILARSANHARFSRGEEILAPGVVNRDVWVLWQGRARMTPADHPERGVDLANGDVFGLLSRSARAMVPPVVVALTDCEVIRIDAEAANAVAGRNPRVTEALNQILTSRSRRLQPTVAGHAVTIQGPGDASTPSTSEGETSPPNEADAETPA